VHAKNVERDRQTREDVGDLQLTVNQAYPSRSLIADLERATPKAKIIQGRTYCGAEFESKTNKFGLRSAQDRGNALVDNAAVQHGRIHPDACGVVLRGGLQNAEVVW
jgi:hypothetical protein